MAYLNHNTGGDPGAVPAGGWSWPDPDEYGEDSFVVICEDTPQDMGPYGDSICGVPVNIDADEETYVDVYAGGAGVDAVGWSIYNRFHPDGDLCFAAVRAYYSWYDNPGGVPPEDYPVPELSPGYAEGGQMEGGLAPDGEPDPWPQIDPMLDPPLRPKPRRITIPYHLIPHLQPNPFRSPVEQSSHGYGIVVPPGLGAQEAQPEPQVGGAYNMMRVHRWDWKQRRWRPGWHRRARPGKKVREKKLTPSAVGGMIIPLIGGLTEAGDVIDALWYALPTQVRKREWREGGHYLGGYGSRLRFEEDKKRVDRFGRPFIGYLSPSDKAGVLWRYLDHVDWNKAMWNLLSNLAEDYVIGQASKKAARGLTRNTPWGRARPFSPFTGPAL